MLSQQRSKTFLKSLSETSLDEFSAPRIDLVAESLARKYNWTIVPAGDTVLNMLHLSTQATNNWHYVSDGPYREYRIGGSTLKFTHTTTREITGKSKMTVMVIQALRALGRNNITANELSKLRNILSLDDMELLLEEAKTATAWIYQLIKKIANTNNEVMP